MKDFEEIYDKLMVQFKDKAELIENEKKKASNYAFKKLIRPILLIITIFIILVLITKKLEILILLIFIPGPLAIYYFITKGNQIRTNITPSTDVMNQIYNVIITNSFDGLTYCNQAKGISKETYDKGCFKKYSKYYSEVELNGILNNKNKVEMSYVVTTNEYFDRNSAGRKNIHYIFSGYLLLIELNNKSNVKMRIDEQEVDFLDDQSPSFKNDEMINNIKNILKKFKKENNILADCTLINNQMYLRVYTSAFGIQELDYILDKEILRKYYVGISKIISLANEILKCINE